MSISDKSFKLLLNHWVKHGFYIILIWYPLMMIIQSMPQQIPANAVNYLEKYNYLTHAKNHKLASLVDIEEAIRTFQNIAGLRITGIYDKDTKDAMTWPRCGVPDFRNEDFESPDADASTNAFLHNHQRSTNAQRTNIILKDIPYKQRKPNFEPYGWRPSRGRSKRYILQGTRWASNSLTYKILKYTTDLSEAVIDDIIEKSFKVWTKHANLNITRIKRGTPHIYVSFEKGQHNDGEPFDGPGKVLAHAFFPQYGGDAHFDDDEKWTSSMYAGANLFQVASHEFGHSLGLSHSTNRAALMAPFYKTFQGDVKLHEDDIRGIQNLYGRKNTIKTPPVNGRRRDEGWNRDPKPKTTLKPRPKKPYSPDSWFKDLFNLFSGRRKMPGSSDTGLIDETGSEGGKNPPHPPFYGIPPVSSPSVRPRISERPGDGANLKPPTTLDKPVDKRDICSDSKIDAITTTPTNKTYVFKDQYYWELDDEGIKYGFPRLTINDWPGITGNVDAALSWGGKINKIFLFKGTKYWRYSFTKDLDIGYPKLISKGFPGLPDSLDAAFVWSGNGMTYFIKDNQYWRYAGTSPEGIDEGYPKQLHIWRGLPLKIDAAMQWKNGRTYFFSGSDYYRFNDREFEVEDTFPRSAALWWFGCFANQYNIQSSRFDSLVLDNNNNNNNDDKSSNFSPQIPTFSSFNLHSTNNNNNHHHQGNHKKTHRNRGHLFKYSALKKPKSNMKSGHRNNKEGKEVFINSNNKLPLLLPPPPPRRTVSLSELLEILNITEEDIRKNPFDRNITNLSSDPDSRSQMFHDLLQNYITTSNQGGTELEAFQELTNLTVPFSSLPSSSATLSNRHFIIISCLMIIATIIFLGT